MTTSSAIAAVLLAGTLLALVACDPPAAPAPEGVGPTASAPVTAAPERPRVELATPEPPRTVAPGVEPAAKPTKPAAPAVVPDGIADLGPFEVVAWDEAEARARRQIDATNADAELEKIRLELENRP